MTDETDRRISDAPLGDTARILAILYTVGFFAIVFFMMWRGIPAENKDAINQLIGGLTIIQTGILGFYFGGSKAGELGQRAALVSKDKSDAVIAEIAKASPIPVGPVVTPAPATAEGVIPAAEVAKEK